MESPEAFTLKDFLVGPDAAQATLGLSPSYAQTMTMTEVWGWAERAFGANPLADISLSYPPLFGHPDLRAEIQKGYPGLGPDQIVVTAGLDDALATIALALVAPGERVIVHTPSYQPHRSTAAWRGAQIVPWPGHEADAWAPDLDQLAELLRQPTRLVFTSLPHNPTGFMPDKAFLARMIDLVEASGAILIADEIYSGLPADQPWPGPLACRSERVISLHGLSKTRGLPGLRMGWLASRNDEGLAAIKALRKHTNSYNSAVSEALATAILRHDDQILARNTEILRTNMAVAEEFFHRHDNLFAWTTPKAGVNGFPRWHGPGNTTELSLRLLREAQLLVAPSTYFGAGEQHMRIGLGLRNFAEGLNRLDSFLAKI